MSPVQTTFSSISYPMQAGCILATRTLSNLIIAGNIPLELDVPALHSFSLVILQVNRLSISGRASRSYLRYTPSVT
ncbi:hypothetical protein PtB15_11B418 [Puccinia triticina]|nr:hypothetical protein PtB15_11B418 [Puccinia triticina]